jgi:predicted DNA-binding protein with PD1-like motif
MRRCKNGRRRRAVNICSVFNVVKTSFRQLSISAKKEYGSKEYVDAMEVASMTGNIALVDGEPFVHAHAVLSGIVPGSENGCIGGHVFEAKVAVTLEVHLVAFADAVTRELDPEIGLKLLNL